MKPFKERLSEATRQNDSLVCVGLDPDPDMMPVTSVIEFNKAIIDATKDLVCAYKPNLSFYEALGIDGLVALEKTVSHIRSVAPNVVIIGDAKRGDIASTAAMYARAMFEYWGFDATTVNAYGGRESLEPFLEYDDKGTIIWCRSSNQGAKDIQDLTFELADENISLYEWIARLAFSWNTRDNIGLVVGSTYPKELQVVRSICPGMPILIPGIGVQGGGLENAVKLGLDTNGHNIIISSSRGIIYRSRDVREYPDRAREAAKTLQTQINRIISGDRSR